METIEDVVEVKHIPCQAESIETLDTQCEIVIKFSGELNTLPAILANAFEATYNLLSLEFCDPTFRRVVRVELEEFTRAEITGEYVLLFAVTAEFLGVEGAVTALFPSDDDRLLTVETTSHSAILNEKTQCICSIDAIDGSVTLDMFGMSLNKFLVSNEFEWSKGMIVSVLEIPLEISP